MTPKALELAGEEGRTPTWEMALLYPDQGGWTEAEYLRLDIGRHVDFANGFVELQAMPDEKHQAILFFLVQALKAFAAREGGKATMAPFPMRLWEEKYREPDALFMRREHVDRCGQKYWQAADLVVEVLSESNRDHDLNLKRDEYAQAGIPEYWIVDPDEGKIMVLALEGKEYAVHGEFTKGQEAVSRVLPGFGVDVASALDAR
jgi:Uma2 family endonuclease